MPKAATKGKDLVARYLREFPNETFKTDSNILFCSCCDKQISTSQRFLVTQHIATAKHKENKEKIKASTNLHHNFNCFYIKW